MKKILSFVLAAAAAMQLCVGGMCVSAAETSVVKKTYSVEQLASFRPSAAGSAATRTFSFDTYQVNGKIYAYLVTNDEGLLVYDVTDPADIGAPIQTVSTITTTNNNLMTTEICGDKLYTFSHGDDYLHCINIGTDSKLDMSTDITSSHTPKFLNSADNFVFEAVNNQKYIDVYDASSDTPLTSIARYTDTSSTATNIRAMSVHEVGSGIYRIAYILQTGTSEFEMNVVDYNSEAKEFNLVCEAVVGDWTTNSFSNIAFLSDTSVAVHYNQEAYYTINIAGGICQIEKVQEQKTGGQSAYLQELYDGEIAAWNAPASYIKDFTSDIVNDITSSSMITADAVKDADITGDVNDADGALVYLARDNQVIIARVKRASVTEEPYTNNNVITVNPGEVKSLPAERLRTSVAAEIGSKTVVYGLSAADGSLYAYDVTDGETAAQIGAAVTASNPKDAEMYVKDGYLIFGNGNNVQINELNDDGSVGAQKYSYATGGSVASVRMADDLLFAGSMNKNNGVTVYDISEPSNTKLLGTIVTDNTVRGIDVEKISNIRYRLYILTQASVDDISTLKLTIKDVIYALGSYSAESVLEAVIPAYDGFGWPGYNDYAAEGSGNIAVVKEGYIAVECEGKGRFIVDATNPADPKVIKSEKFTATGDYRQRKMRLDKTKVVEVRRNTEGAYIVDYTNPAEPKEIAEIKGMKGDGASILNNYLYTTLGNEIRILKLCDDGVSYGNIEFDKAAVVTEDTTAVVAVTNNTANAVAATLIIALYDGENRLAAVETKNGDIAAHSAGTVSATISKDFIPTDTTGFYFKAMLWESMQTMKPIMDCEILGK